MSTLTAIIKKYRERHQQLIQRALNTKLTQEYRTWHHIQAETLAPLLAELEELDPPSKDAEEDLIASISTKCSKKKYRSWE